MKKLFLKHPIIFIAVWYKLKVMDGNEYISRFKEKGKKLFARK